VLSVVRQIMSVAIADGSESPPPPVPTERRAVTNFKFRAAKKAYMPNVGANGHHGIIKKLDWPGWRCKQAALTMIPQFGKDWEVSMEEAENNFYERIDESELQQSHWKDAEETTLGKEAQKRSKTKVQNISIIPRIIYEQGWLNDSPRILASLSIKNSSANKRSALPLRSEPRPTRAAARTGAAIVTALTSANGRKRRDSYGPTNEISSASASVASKRKAGDALQETKDSDETSEESRLNVESAYKKTAFGGFEPGVRVEWMRQVTPPSDDDNFNEKNENDHDSSIEPKYYTVRGTIVGVTSNGYRTVIADGGSESHAYRPKALRIVSDESERTAKRHRVAAERVYSEQLARQRMGSARRRQSSEASESRHSPKNDRTSSTGKRTKKKNLLKDGMRVRVIDIIRENGSNAVGSIEFSACGYRWVRLDDEPKARPFRMHRLEPISKETAKSKKLVTRTSPLIGAPNLKPTSRKSGILGQSSSRLSSVKSPRTTIRRDYDISALAAGCRVEMIPTDGSKRRPRGTIVRVSGNGCRFVVLDGEKNVFAYRPWQLQLLESNKSTAVDTDVGSQSAQSKKISISSPRLSEHCLRDGTPTTNLSRQDRARLSKEDLATIHNKLTIGSRVVVDYNHSGSAKLDNFDMGTVEKITHGFRYVKIDGQSEPEAIRPSRLTLLADIPGITDLVKSGHNTRSSARGGEIDTNLYDTSIKNGTKIPVPPLPGARVLAVVNLPDGTVLKREGIFQGSSRQSRFHYVLLDGETKEKAFLAEEIKMLSTEASDPVPAPASRASPSTMNIHRSLSPQMMPVPGSQEQFNMLVKGARVRVIHDGMDRGLGIIERVVRGYRYVLLDGQTESLPFRPGSLELLGYINEDVNCAASSSSSTSDNIIISSSSKRPLMLPDETERKSNDHPIQTQTDIRAPTPKRTKRKSQRYFGPLPLSSAFRIGGRVLARWARDQGIYSATITALHPDHGAVDLEYEDGDYWERAPVAMVIECLD